uniref:Uncharacterized protein n=1 Tax=Manihot esculenta TaxID=3983 RepID=A0A2C9W1A5_MANES
MMTVVGESRGATSPLQSHDIPHHIKKQAISTSSFIFIFATYISQVPRFKW